jgi:hypothetical protein
LSARRFAPVSTLRLAPPLSACQQGEYGSFLRGSRRSFCPKAVSQNVTGQEPNGNKLKC